MVSGVVLGSDLGVAAGEGIWIEEGTGAVDGAEEFVEATLAGPVVFWVGGFDLGGDVPFSGHVGAVAGGLEGFGDGEAFFVQESLVLGDAVVACHVANASLVGVEAGEEGSASRAAAGRVVKLSETHSVGCEGIKIGRFDLTSVAADIGVAHVIGHDDNDIGPLGRKS